MPERRVGALSFAETRRDLAQVHTVVRHAAEPNQSPLLMLLERRTVSRKTPADGKLEISRATADAIAPRRERITTEWRGRTGAAALVEMTCSCAKGAGGQHQHLFLQSDLFRALEAGAEVELRLDEATDRVSVTPAR